MLAHAPRISDCFLRYEHHRNRSSLCLFARRQSHFPIVIRTTACSPFRYCPGCQCPSQVPNPHLFQAYLSGGVGIPRASTRALKVCSSLCHPSFSPPIAMPMWLLHPFHFTFLPTSSPTFIVPELHYPPPSLTPALGLALSRAALSAPEATRQSQQL